MSVHAGEDKKGFILYRVKFVEPALTFRHSASLRIWPSAWGKTLETILKGRVKNLFVLQINVVAVFFEITKILLLERSAPKINKLDPESSNFCWNHWFYLYWFTHPYRNPFQCSYCKLNTCLGTTKITDSCEQVWKGFPMQNVSPCSHLQDLPWATLTTGSSYTCITCRFEVCRAFRPRNSSSRPAALVM